MAEFRDKSPLLVNIEEESIDYIDARDRIKHSKESTFGFRQKYLNGEDDVTLDSQSNAAKNLSDSDYIVSIFVVAFDTRAGNIVEWCMPEETCLDGIEFKAMASGSHRINKDFIYFKKENLYGLACFENMPVESEIERGARMKSVGILATSYTMLYRHMQFLEMQVRHQLEIPGKYFQLQAFYEDRKFSPASTNGNEQINTSSPQSTPGREELPDMTITHPAGCFSQFIKFFGEQIIVLWKFALLRKRILFFSPPPIGVVCYRVYCCCCLPCHTVPEIVEKEIQPLFYVNVADIDTIEAEMSYIACTTEKIFESKKHLYDVYVDNQNVITHNEILKELLHINSSDKDKFQKLSNQRAAHLFLMQEMGTEVVDDEDVFSTFFTEQNNRIFQTLLDVSLSQDKQLTSDHMRSIGLDPVADRQFLMELVETYGIDVMLMVDNPCCPK